MKAGEPKEAPKRAFIYCRTSDDADEAEDSKKLSIETQEAEGLAMAERHGYKVLKVFKDRNRSGRLYPKGFEIPDLEVEAFCNSCKFSKTNRSREQLGELMRRLGEIDVIIVRRADRLMRPLPLSKLDTHILPILKCHNIVIHSHDENIIDPKNDQHVAIFRLKSTFESKYVSDRREETLIAIRDLRDTGKLYFPPSFYGFRSKGHQEVRRVENEIKILKNIYADFLAGKPLKAIARNLNSLGVPLPTLKREAKNGKGFWLDSTIRAILKRPQYAGVQYKSNGTDLVQVDVFQPPVVSLETFKKVQDILAERQTGRIGNTKELHALGGLCYCGYCGYKLYTSCANMVCNDTRYKVDSLRCMTPSKTNEKKQCLGVQIRERFPKGLSRRDGKAYTNGLEDCLFPLIYKGYINHLIAKARRVGLDEEIEKCHADLERNELHIRSLGQKLRDKGILENTFAILVKEASDAREKLETTLAGLEKEANAIDRVDVPSKLYADFASHKLPNELKRRLFHHVIDRIDVWRDRLQITLKDGAQFTLNRIRRGKTFDLPAWRIVPVNNDSHTAEPSSDSKVLRVRYKHTPIKEDTKIDVVYMYDNYDPQQNIYGDQNLIVRTEGSRKRIPTTDAAAPAGV